MKRDRLLADEASQAGLYHVVSPDLPRRIREAHVLVLRDEVVSAMVDLAHATPKLVNDLRQGFRLPWSAVWMEFNQQAFSDALSARNGYENLYTPRKSGMLVWERDDGLIELACVAGPEDGRSKKPLEWPLRFVFSPDEREAMPPASDGGDFGISEGNYGAETVEYSRAVWGYVSDKPVALGELHRRAYVYVPAPYGRLTMENRAPFKLAMAELSGIVRMALAALALINGPTMRVPEKPAQPRILIGGKSVASREREVVTLCLPKRVTDRAAYIRREVMAAAKRRLHRVRGHYRYLRAEPMALGWERVEVAGTSYWRKWIASFQRGSAELGVVPDAKATLVQVR